MKDSSIIKTSMYSILIALSIIITANTSIFYCLSEQSVFVFSYANVIIVTSISLLFSLLYISGFYKPQNFLKIIERYIPIKYSESFNRYLSFSFEKKLGIISYIHSPLLFFLLFPFNLQIPVFGNFCVALNELLKLLIPMAFFIIVANQYYGLTLIKLNNFIDIPCEQNEYPEKSMIFLLTGASYLMFIFFTLSISVLFFAFGFSLSKLVLPLAFACTAIFTWVTVKTNIAKKQRKTIIVIIALLIVSVITFYILSSNIYNFGFDSQAYHSEMVIQLKKGWNPFYEVIKNGDYDYVERHSSQTILLNSFSKGSEIIAAAAYRFFESYEGSKVFQFLFIMSAFFISTSVFLTFKKIPFLICLLLGFTISLNPIAITECFSFYVDGELANMLLIVTALGALLFLYENTLIRILLGASIIIGMNLKFTGVIYMAIFITGILFCYLIFNKARFNKKNIGALLFSFFIGISIIGYNPYITNTIKYGSPFFPYFATGNLEQHSMESNTDMRIVGITQTFSTDNISTRISNLCHTVFSKTKGGYNNRRLEWPFSIELKEFKQLLYPSPHRLGGFGPLFRTIIILAVFLLFFTVPVSLRKFTILFSIIIWIFMSVLLTSLGCYARYAPQLWLIPVIIIPIGFYIDRRLFRFLSYALLLFVFLSSVLYSVIYFRGQLFATLGYKLKFEELIGSDNKLKISFYRPYRSANIARFREMGIDFEELEIERWKEADIYLDSYDFHYYYDLYMNNK